MVLSLPVAPDATENAVEFVSLEGYPSFFEDMNAGFFMPKPIPMVGASPGASRKWPKISRLLVHDVGDFEASFVPTISDFDRLDARFRLPNDVWAKLPAAYQDYGFAVFKLKGFGRAVHAASKLTETWPIRASQRLKNSLGALFRLAMHHAQPMAVEFLRRDGEPLFFPTVHVHNGNVPEFAEFDHDLFCQVSEPTSDMVRGFTATGASWLSTDRPAGDFMDSSRVGRLIDPSQVCWYVRLVGSLRNQDAHVGEGGQLPTPEDLSLWLQEHERPH